ncbi:hypothetical protein FKP32DRAFT_947067 [Trametes sanguinea]|nr:hypothetical protein FKP32DRAFT_947067 [Trametes sanguinea]
MSATNTAHGAPTAPQIWSCNWNWCSETFRQGSELAKHVAEAHFKHILQVKEREWDLYLRSSKGQSGATDAWARYKSLIPKVTPSPPPTSSRPVPPLPRNLSRKRPSPTSTDDTTSPPKNPPVIPRTSLFRSHPNSVSPNPVNSQHAASSDESPPSPKRRRKSFATCAAQSSPMSTPSLPSVPPSPALSNMITDAINAAGRLNSLSPSKRLVKLSESAGDVHSQSASATSGYPRPLPRRTTLGASPSPSGPPKLSHTTSFASAQAIEDALTQNLSPAASPTSDAKERALSSSLQYPSQENSEDSKPGSQQPSPEHDSAAYTAHGSHAVSSAPQLSSTYDAEPSTHSSHNPSPARPPSPEHPSPSQSQPSPPIKVIPPLPRRKRAPFAAVPASQPPPATRILRSRSKTPAPAPPVQSQTLQLPRRTTRSRASSATTATVHATAPVGAGKVTVEDVKPKRARSKPPSEGGKAGKGRSRSRSQSRAPSAASASKTRTNHGGSLPAVDELSDDEREGKPDPAVLDTTSPACPPDPYAHLNQKGPYSGTLYIPVPSQLSPSQSAGIDKEIKRELIETGVNEPSSQPLHQSPQFASQSQSSSQLQSSQAGSGSGSGYVEGYGFDMGSLVLQTQAPYQWSQSQ